MVTRTRAVCRVGCCAVWDTMLREARASEAARIRECILRCAGGVCSTVPGYQAGMDTRECILRRRRVREVRHGEGARAHAAAVATRAAGCNAVQHVATQGGRLQRRAAGWDTVQHVATRGGRLGHSATRCNTGRQVGTQCNMLQRGAAGWDTVQRASRGAAVARRGVARSATAAAIVLAAVALGTIRNVRHSPAGFLAGPRSVLNSRYCAHTLDRGADVAGVSQSRRRCGTGRAQSRRM